MLQNYSYRLKALLITRKHWRHQTQRTIKNALGEDLPFALVLNRGLKEATKGWTSAPFQMCWRSGTTYLNRNSRASRAAVECGWGRGLTLKQSRERWSRHGSTIPANHMDNYSEINGATVTSYEHLRWGIRWVSRAFGGWTASAALSDIFRGLFFSRESERQDYRGWNMGCPDWYSEHHP